MKCADFQLALDSAGARALSAEARAHAAACAACGREQALALEVEARLATHFDVREAMPGAGFADTVMARVERQPRTAPAANALAWREAASQVGVAAALGLAASALLAGLAARPASDWLGTVLAALGPAIEQPSPRTIAVLAALTPLLAVAGIAAWKLGENLAESPPRAS